MRHIAALAAAAALLSGSGCAYFRPTQDQIGSAHVGVLSVVRLTEDLGNTLQPTFKLDAEQALSKVAPVTMRVSETRATSFSAIAAVGSTAQASSGAPPKAATLPEVHVTSVTIEAPIDPISRYAAAASLFQEVQLLNGYVKNATTRSKHTPYVVRLQVALMPLRRGEPYDVYLNIAFFANDDAVSRANSRASTCTFETSLSSPAASQLALSAGGASRPALSTVTYPNPHAVPLFVTDNMELTSRTRDESDSREAAFALAPLRDALVTMAGGSLGFSDKRSRAEAGYERNSRLTVTRLSDNSLRVRIGAAQRPKSGYVMDAQNHAITLLLLVPEELSHAQRPEIQVMSWVSFVHASEGYALKRRPIKKAMKQLEVMAETLRLGTPRGVCGQPPQTAAGALAGLVSMAQKDDYPLFAERFADLWPDRARSGFGPNVFTSLLGMLPGGDFYGASFQLPNSSEAKTAGSAAPAKKPQDKDPKTIAKTPDQTQDKGSKKP